MIQLRFFKPLGYFVLVSYLSTVYCPEVNAQKLTIGTWNILNIRYQWSEKWSVFGEAQLRSLQLYNQFHYHEWKVGALWQFDPKASFALAFGEYDTYREGGNFVTPKNADEVRIWPQFLIREKLGKVTVEHRYRMEMRFINGAYRNRFRLRVGVNIPVLTKALPKLEPQLSANNELFFTDKPTYFERNRLSVSLALKLSTHLRFQLGYLHQFDYRINDETGRDFIVTGLFIDIRESQGALDTDK